MPEDDDGAEAEPGALLEAGAGEPGPDALALMLRDDGHRREAHNLQRGMTGKRHGREQDVADDGAAVVRHERNDRLRLFAQEVKQRVASAGVSNAVALTVWTAARSSGCSARISIAFNRRSGDQENKTNKNS